jgi:hypothetical protein
LPTVPLVGGGLILRDKGVQILRHTKPVFLQYGVKDCPLQEMWFLRGVYSLKIE